MPTMIERPRAVSGKAQVACIDGAQRASNAELAAWLAEAHDSRESFHLLLCAVTPLLRAYFDGQLRGCRADSGLLALETMVAVYRHRAGFDSRQPFRAWLLALAMARAARWRQEEHGAAMLPSLAPVLATGSVDHAGGSTPGLLVGASLETQPQWPDGKRVRS